MTREVWRPVPMFPDYQVSNHGRVRRIVRASNGSPAGRVLKTWAGLGGVVYVALRAERKTHHCEVENLRRLAFAQRAEERAS